jgi:hypothetical protein
MVGQIVEGLGIIGIAGQRHVTRRIMGDKAVFQRLDHEGGGVIILPPQPAKDADRAKARQAGGEAPCPGRDRAGMSFENSSLVTRWRVCSADLVYSLTCCHRAAMVAGALARPGAWWQAGSPPAPVSWLRRPTRHQGNAQGRAIFGQVMLDGAGSGLAPADMQTQAFGRRPPPTPPRAVRAA